MLKVFEPRPGFVLNLAAEAQYTDYEIALQKMGNGTIREMNPEYEKDLLPTRESLPSIFII